MGGAIYLGEMRERRRSGSSADARHESGGGISRGTPSLKPSSSGKTAATAVKYVISEQLAFFFFVVVFFIFFAVNRRKHSQTRVGQEVPEL